jgi:N-formylglutamate amidohydrolase
MTPFSFHAGKLPLLISIPHAGTEVPDVIRDRMSRVGRDLPDTDWYVDQLYEFAIRMGASVIKANYSRYVVDLNRSPDSSPLYEANPTSPVCAVRTFGGEEIYLTGKAPTAAEVVARVQQYWRPYHNRLREELLRIRSQHGFAALWDAHSIASEVPGLFAGVLPEFNLGTRNDSACPAQIGTALLRAVEDDGRYSAVLNGRFTGGYITLNYGQPSERICAVQLELAQRAYMNEGPVLEPFDASRASTARDLIESLLGTYVASARAGFGADG